MTWPGQITALTTFVRNDLNEANPSVYNEMLPLALTTMNDTINATDGVARNVLLIRRTDRWGSECGQDHEWYFLRSHPLYSCTACPNGNKKGHCTRAVIALCFKFNTVIPFHSIDWIHPHWTCFIQSLSVAFDSIALLLFTCLMMSLKFFLWKLTVWVLAPARTIIFQPGSLLLHLFIEALRWAFDIGRSKEKT